MKMRLELRCPGVLEDRLAVEAELRYQAGKEDSCGVRVRSSRWARRRAESQEFVISEIRSSQKRESSAEGAIAGCWQG